VKSVPPAAWLHAWPSDLLEQWHAFPQAGH
jgi:hypothetical protein